MVDVLPVDMKRDGDHVRIVPNAMYHASWHSYDIAYTTYFLADLLEFGVTLPTIVIHSLIKFVLLWAVYSCDYRPRAVVVRRGASMRKPAHSQNSQRVVGFLVQ